MLKITESHDGHLIINTHFICSIRPAWKPDSETSDSSEKLSDSAARLDFLEMWSECVPLLYTMRWCICLVSFLLFLVVHFLFFHRVLNLFVVCINLLLSSAGEICVPTKASRIICLLTPHHIGSMQKFVWSTSWINIVSIVVTITSAVLVLRPWSLFLKKVLALWDLCEGYSFLVFIKLRLVVC